MHREAEAKEFRCPNVSENCVGSKCMAWEWVSKFEDIIYENAQMISDTRKKDLEKLGYNELPAHGLILGLKTFFPITEEEKTKMANMTFGTQLLFGKETTDTSVWIGRCSSCTKE